MDPGRNEVEVVRTDSGYALLRGGEPYVVRGVGMAVDDTIHFISWLRRNNAACPDTAAAIVKTFHDVGKPIVMTTFLLCSGFLVLMMGSIIPTRMFGMLTAVSMGFALIGDLFVLPPLVLIFKPGLPPLARRNNNV